MKKYISSRFQGVEGGLFTKVTKADVGDNFASMEGEVVLMGWADPFYPDPSVPENVKNALMGFSVAACDPCPVYGRYHRQILQTDIVQNLVIGTL